MIRLIWADEGITDKSFNFLKPMVKGLPKRLTALQLSPAVGTGLDKP